MFKKIYRILFNHPTDIEGPVFIKPYSHTNKQISDLEILLKDCDDKSRKHIESDIKKLRYGQIGENNIYHELKNSFIPMICLYNLRIKYKNMTAQIDFIAITSKYIYVIECKNLVGDIVITKEGEFIRSKKNSYGKVVSQEGMYSPIAQNERHINVIKEILKNELHYKSKLDRIESLIVSANPKTIIDKKEAPKSIRDKIIRYDQIVDRINSKQENHKISWEFTEDDMREISECLINYNKEVKIDYKKKYSLEPARKYESAEELREALKSYRTSMSQKENVKPYMVFTNDTIEELILSRPKNLYELRHIRGFGMTKCKKYGDDLIEMMG